jgi:hypothetical protein
MKAASDWIASLQLIVVAAEGTERGITAHVGAPYPIPDGSWACAVAIEGLPRRFPDVHGNSSLQALCLAIWLIRKQAEEVIARGGRILDASDRSELSPEVLAAIFGGVDGRPTS